jgi:hypothetical protein
MAEEAEKERKRQQAIKAREERRKAIGEFKNEHPDIWYPQGPNK